MFTQFSEIASRFFKEDKAKGVKRLLFSPVFGLIGAHFTLIKVNYVKNAIFENYFEQFSHFPIL